MTLSTDDTALVRLDPGVQVLGVEAHVLPEPHMRHRVLAGLCEQPRRGTPSSSPAELASSNRPFTPSPSPRSSRSSFIRRVAVDRRYLLNMWVTVGGIAVTFGGLIAAVLIWLVDKLKGRDFFDQVMREAEPSE